MKKSVLLVCLCILCLSPGWAQGEIHAILDAYGVRGSTTVYDYQAQQWHYSDSVDAHTETLPASTFKIIHSLIALEEQAVADEHEIIPWDGVVKTAFGQPIDKWNQDHDLAMAYRNSTVWFYVELAQRIGRARYPYYLDACGYGNGDLSEPNPAFWVVGDFAVSPKNQVEFLVKLHEETLGPFSPETYKIVKQIMVSEETEAYTVRSKTGWTTHNGEDIGWWVGYITKGEQIYFFATRIRKDEEMANEQFGAARVELTREVLNEWGMWEK